MDPNLIITVALLVVWYLLTLVEVPVTPYDIYAKWMSQIAYLAPECDDIALSKTRRAIRQVEKVFDQHGPNGDAGAEAAEVLKK